MIDRRVADLVVVGHLAYLAFLPVGVLLVARRPHLVPLHLAAVAVALASVTVGFDCPLTTWEQTLRRRGGQHPDPGGFVNHYLTGGAFPHGADRVAQIAVAVLIVAAYLRLARRGRTRSRTSASHVRAAAPTGVIYRGYGRNRTPKRRSGPLQSNRRS